MPVKNNANFFFRATKSCSSIRLPAVLIFPVDPVYYLYTHTMPLKAAVLFLDSMSLYKQRYGRHQREFGGQIWQFAIVQSRNIGVAIALILIQIWIECTSATCHYSETNLDVLFLVFLSLGAKIWPTPARICRANMTICYSPIAPFVLR